MTKTQAAAAPKTAAKPVKADIVTLRHLATEVAETQGLSQKQANEVLSEAITAIGKHLKKGARIRIAGLGTLEVRKRAARMGRNPATGEAYQNQGKQEGCIPPRKGFERVDLTGFALNRVAAGAGSAPLLLLLRRLCSFGRNGSLREDVSDCGSFLCSADLPSL